MSDRGGRRRLTGREIGLLKFLLKHCGLTGRVRSASRYQREIALPLWRRGLVEIWWRQVPEGPMHGPFLTPSLDGCRIAGLFVASRFPQPMENQHESP